MEPTGETDKEKTDGSPKIPALFVFFPLCYIVVIVKNYKLRLATVDPQSSVFFKTFIFALMNPPYLSHLPHDCLL